MGVYKGGWGLGVGDGVEGVRQEKGEGTGIILTPDPPPLTPLLCGLLLGCAYGVRGLAALVWPAPLVGWFGAWWLDRSKSGQSSGGEERGVGGAEAGLEQSGWYLVGLGVCC